MAGGLAQALGAADGIDMDEAVRRSAVNMTELKGKAADELDRCVLGIEAKVALGGAGSRAVREELHALSCTIAGMAGMFGFPGLSRAAYCFCRLLDEALPGLDHPAVKLNVNAMRLLLSGPPMNEEAQGKLCAYLDKLRIHAAQTRGASAR
jgi:hypothetical protein